MTDQPTYPDANSNTRADPGSGSAHDASGAPRWVKVFGILALVAALMLVIMLLTGGGGGHGPGRHTGSGSGGHTAPPSATNLGDQSP